MNRQTLGWGRSRFKVRGRDPLTEWLGILGLLLAALMLFLVNLGELPLRDWDEGLVARIAWEIESAPSGSWRWLFPTLWGEPYLNKPPLVHDCVALAFRWAGVSEWTARLPGALLSAISVPLLYGVGREVFASRKIAFYSALTYLTLLPVVRHGRLAMLDGALLCFAVLTLWCALRSRRDLRWCLGLGLGISLMCLTKGVAGVLIGGMILLFLAWDTPRLLGSVYLWSGLFLGALPALTWYGMQWERYPNDFARVGLLEQSLERLWSPVDGQGGPPWYYGEQLVHALPWLLFAGSGWRLAWQQRNWSWAKLVLVWSGVYFAIVSLMATKHPWYILPLYPALALAAAAAIAHAENSSQQQPYPRWWSVGLGAIALAALGASLYTSLGIEEPDYSLTLVAVSVTLSTGIAAVGIVRRDVQFIPMLFWGLFVSLLLLVSSNAWLWELNEAYPVKPVAEIIRSRDIAPERTIYTSFPYERPSLNFYAGRRIVPATDEQLRDYWQREKMVYLLLDREALARLDLPQERLVKLKIPQLPQWQLVSKRVSSGSS